MDTQKPLLAPRARLLITLALVAVIAVASIVLYTRVQRNKNAAAYNEAMQAGLADAPSLAFMDGNALAAYDEAKGIYTDQYIPAGLRADDPTQVRAILRYAYGENKVGGYGLGGSAFERTVRVSIHDAVTGEVFPHASKEFAGGDPPSTVSAFSGDHYGSWPDGNEVTRWVGDIWPELAYHRMMAGAFSYGVPRAYGLGDKLVVLWNGEFVTALLPDDLVAAAPEEVGAFVRRVSKVENGNTVHTFTFISPETGEAIEGMEKKFIFERKSYFASRWEEEAAEMTAWIAETWAEYRQENKK